MWTYVPAPPTIMVWSPIVIDPWRYRAWIKVFSKFHLSFRNSATRFKVLVPPIMYAALGLWAVEYSDILLKWSLYKLFWIIRHTLSQMGNQDHQTISLYSYPKSPSRRNSLHCFYNIRWLELFLCSFQGHVYFDVSTLKIQLNRSFRHRNWMKNEFKNRWF